MSQVISETSIVVIDNDMGMRDLFALSLKSECRQVFTYPYVQIDLTALKQHRPDLIILDFNEQDGRFYKCSRWTMRLLTSLS